MKNNLKGSALIVVLMIVTVLMILGVGQLVLVDQITNVGVREQIKNQLFWAAEAGANHAFSALEECSGDTKSNLDGQAASAASTLTTKLAALTFGNVTTKVTVDYTSPKFKITSVATLNGKTCTVVIDDLLGIPPLDFPMIMLQGMESGRGLDPGTNMFGKTYFGGFANPTTYDNADGTFDTPVFWGPVISSANKHDNPSVYYKGFLRNRDVAMSKFFEDGDYAAGLHLNNRIKDNTADNNNYTDYTKEQVIDRANQMFKGGYKYAQPLPAANSLTFTWSEFSACTDNVTKISTSDATFATHAGKDIKIVFNGTTARVYFKKTAVANATVGDGTGSDISKYNPPQVIDLTSSSTNGHLLLIDKNFGTVFIEGNVGASTTMVTEANNVVITDDLYYTGLNGKTWNGKAYTDIPTSVYQNPTTAKEAFLAMQNEVNKVTTKFAVLAGVNTTDELKSRISVSPTTAVNNPNKSVFTTGAFFSSSGRHGIESYRNNDGADQGYWKIGNGLGQIAIVNVGCMAFKTKGKYSQEYKDATHRGYGIVTVFGTDFRYVNGISPFGFKAVRFSDKKRWSVSWN